MPRRPGRPPKALDPSASAAAALGAELRRLRHGRSLTLVRLAEMTEYSPQHLGAIERGCAVPSETIVARADAALGACGGLLGLLPEVIREQAHIRHRNGAARRPVPAAEGQPPSTEEHLAWERLAHAGQRVSRVTPSILQDLELISDRQRSLYHELSSAEMLAQVETHHALLTGFLQSSAPDALRRRIASAAAEAAGFTAWLWFDLGDAFRMRCFYRQANDALAEARDPSLAVYIKGFEAMAAGESGKRDLAVALLAEACDRAPRSLPAITKSWLDALNAKALARIGERRRALASLDRAQRFHDAGRDDGKDPWMFDFDYSSLAGYSGSCYLALGQDRAAATAFEKALVRLPKSCDRRRAMNQVGLARARLGTDDIEDARELACAALATFVGRGSVAGVRRVRRFRNALRETGHTVAALALDEQARALCDTTW
jgi:tetratricopeptide (TPR) repeat protein